MTVKGYIKKNGWIIDCNTKMCRFMNVAVGFVNNSGMEDETEFSIAAYDENELSDLFDEFCKENGFKTNKVIYVAVTEIADSIGELS